MSGLSILKELIERFENNLDAYKSPKYNEAQLRQEFINPMFKLLGWDVRNEKGYAEAYKDVIHEDAIKIGGATKAPDYSFRIGGVRKFFLETKKPSVNIKDDPEPAFQLRRYAWSAKLPLSVLTDFEEFAVYDCRIKPAPNDKPSTGRIMYFNYKEYPEKWEEIASVFSREAILKGSFDRFVESEKKKRGTAEVDDAFLKEIESWRDAIARNIALRNEGLTERDINYAVQLTIDRIIFLRICEDRGIEEYGRLMALQNGEHVYKRMVDLYYRADEKYNSGLFHFQKEKGRPAEPDELTPDLKIDDKVLKDIIKGLYYPESPYEFSVLPVDILGHVYERFLGKVIRLTAGGRAKVEEKPEVRKAGGVYYTPKYIVDYIVENTVGRLLWGKDENRKSERGNQKQKLTPKQAAKLRILDPACGSGSFLIGAYEYLLDWHRDWYVDNDPTKYTKQIYQGAGDQWYLTTGEKKRILLNNIYGVDIDPQAVEVTKLNLLLKALEGESEETIESQLKMFRERALPDLRGNIKCGNSLIDPDFYDNTQLDLLDDEERYRINEFDWGREFGEIMKDGGFDAVIGNPPYAIVGADNPKEQNYFTSNYELMAYKINTYILFLEKGLNLLRNKGSMLGYIIPKSLVFNTYFRDTRRKLLSDYAIPLIVEISEKVFEEAEVGNSILFFASTQNKPLNNNLRYYKVKNIYPAFNIIEEFDSTQDQLIHDAEARFYVTGIKLNVPIKHLSEISKISNGLNPGNVRHILISDKKESNKHQKLVLGRDIQRYLLKWSGKWVNYDPDLKKRLKPSDIKSKKGMTAQKKVDFALRNFDIYRPHKLMIRKTADKIIATYDPDGYFFDSLSYGIQLFDKVKESKYYLLGLLNSKLINFIHASISLNKGKVFAKVLAENLKKLPIRIIDFSNPNDKLNHDRMVLLVDKMLDLHKQLAATKSAPEKTAIQRQIDATDKQIDELVYELYGLTEEERRVVGGA